MKKLLLYLLLFCTGMASAQIVSIPDNNFRNKLLAANTTNNIAKNSGGAPIKVDTNNDTYIQQSEADAVYELDVSSSSISNLTGIQAFNNLRVLNCQGNALSSLILTGIANLETVYCGSNYISTLTITGLSNLRGLYCSDNYLSAINFTGVTDLRWLECNNNQFATLNVSSLANLRELKCNGNSMTALNVVNLGDLRLIECAVNNLTSLDLSGLDHLESLVCYQNSLTALDFTGLGYLISVNCSENQLASLDFSGNPAFNELDCFQNNLTYINIKNGNTQVYDATTAPNNWAGNPGLAFICIDESETAIVDTIVAANGIMVNYNTYCTFVPGGDYNTITGALLFDGDNDGCDTADTPQPFIRIGIDNGTQTGAAFSDDNGNYAFYTGVGTLTVTPQLENDSFFTVTPASGNVVFPIVDNSVVTNNFCIAANGIHPDVEAVIEPLMPAVPGGLATYKVVYKNKGNKVLSGSVTFSCDESFIDYAAVDPAPDAIVPGTYTWNFTGLKPFENREIKIELYINSPTDIPAVNVGNTLFFTSTATSFSGDDIPQDNTFDFNQVAVGSFNPNSITCIEGDTESAAAIGDYLHYVVNLKNTGTQTATSIVVKHDFDPAQFDVASLQVLNSSHAMRTRITGNQAEFIMQNVSMAAAGHGNILFKVKTKPSLMVGSSVTTKARIFFDYDTPVETNDANTVFEDLGRGDFEKDNSIKVYPNPAKTILNITADNTVRSIELYDMQGRLLETGIINDVSTTIDMAARASGIYFVKVTTDKGVKVENVIRE
ncbi:hypothetical protein HYN59_01040 [Flavobacterium album]|uniref:Uncharacterized protein n=1 Tax=Flavobacterium album TaxID=2175091 RepID=A0A2S1QTR6_9FLAO|nr:T9SS type A sorting domain-containing protein [Flavobacterium album]AWH83783.1 hypothetical protein HYN59_01040 [Flavobacterium album]